MSLILETERLALDELAVDRDELFVFELLNEPGFIENIGDRQINDLNAARTHLEGVVAGYERNGFGLWRTRERATGELVGICGLVRRDGLDDPDVGYAFLERAWGKGYAAEAAKATLDHAREVLRLPRVVAITKTTNTGSIKVLQKIGMTAAGTIKLPAYDEPSAYFTT